MSESMTWNSAIEQLPLGFGVGVSPLCAPPPVCQMRAIMAVTRNNDTTLRGMLLIGMANALLSLLDTACQCGRPNRDPPARPGERGFRLDLDRSLSGPAGGLTEWARACRSVGGGRQAPATCRSRRPSLSGRRCARTTA